MARASYRATIFSQSVSSPVRVRAWQAAIAAKPEWIGIVSFDEWHEGTQIEPARDFTAGARTYTGYEGAFGVSGGDAPRAYLARTTFWVNKYAPAG